MSANSGSGSTIIFDNNITLTSGDLPSLASNVTLDGNNFSLSGNNQYRGLVVTPDQFGSPVSVTIQNLTIQNTVGAGGLGSAGGGGGAGSTDGTTAAGGFRRAMTLGATNADSVFGGTITGTGGITKTGTGMLTLSGPNTFSGGIIVNNGTLAAGSDANLGGAGAVSMADQTTLALSGTGTFGHDLLLAGRPLVTVGAGNTVTWNGLVADGRTSGTVQVSGGGTLALAKAANTYSGGTIVTGGSTLLVGADGALGTPGTAVALGDATTKATLAPSSARGR